MESVQEKKPLVPVIFILNELKPKGQKIKEMTTAFQEKVHEANIRRFYAQALLAPIKEKVTQGGFDIVITGFGSMDIDHETKKEIKVELLAFLGEMTLHLFDKGLISSLEDVECIWSGESDKYARLTTDNLCLFIDLQS